MTKMFTGQPKNQKSILISLLPKVWKDGEKENKYKELIKHSMISTHHVITIWMITFLHYKTTEWAKDWSTQDLWSKIFSQKHTTPITCIMEIFSIEISISKLKEIQYSFEVVIKVLEKLIMVSNLSLPMMSDNHNSIKPNT